MITDALDYLRRNAVAFTALGCSLLALSGGAWAASSLRSTSSPAAHATSVDPRPGGYILAWAHVAAGGQVQGGSQGVRLWGGGPSLDGRYFVTWRRLRIPSSCGAVVSPGYADSGGSPRTAMALVEHPPHVRGLRSLVFVQTFNAQDQGARAPFTLEVVC